MDVGSQLGNVSAPSSSLMAIRDSIISCHSAAVRVNVGKKRDREHEMTNPQQAEHVVFVGSAIRKVNEPNPFERKRRDKIMSIQAQSGHREQNAITPKCG